MLKLKRAYKFEKNEIMNLTQEEWKLMLGKHKDNILLDVRTEDEFKEKRIPNSVLLDINSPQEFLEGIEVLDKDKSYFIYCRSGNRSSRACDIMKSMGFKKTYNLLGGISEWKGLTE